MSIHITRGFLPVFFAICVSAFWACNSKQNQGDDLIRQYVKAADSLAIVGKSDSAIGIITRQRKLFKSNDPELVAYYDFMSRMYFTNGPVATAYADSALRVFDDKDNIDLYPDDYYKTLLVKADAFITQKQYANALEYYDKAKKLTTNRECDGGYLTSRIGGIYFHQQNYLTAAHYWVQGFRELQDCHKNKSAQKIFFLTQGALDNIGVMYQRAGMYDSAAYYYKKNVAYIDQVAAEGKVAKQMINSPRFVVYDNLGGLALKQGNLAEAEKYLTACIAIPVKDVDGLRIPPFIKQAELYLKTRRYDKAAIAFSESKRLLDRFGKDNPEPNVEWNNLYAQYLFTQHRTDDAYQYQTKYISLKDSLDKTNSKLRALDVERELNSIHRENLLLELEHNQRLQKLYIVGVTIVLVLLVVISLSVFRVLKESRNNHKSTRLHNQQQQQALEELERANQNIIRIMGIMAHDLRNPLSGMIGLANAIFEDEESEENKHMLKLLETTGIHSLEMINELLKSGLTNEDEQLEKQKLDIKELLRDSVELLQFKANEKKQQITFESDDEPIITAINHEKIWRVFNNLIVNAIKFSYTGGLIFVSIKALADRRKILIAIADNGMGIPEADKEKVFEMFTPVKRLGTEGEQPFGLGLSISKRIIENHNGRLWFESSPGFGTTFYIELPL